MFHVQLCLLLMLVECEMHDTRLGRFCTLEDRPADWGCWDKSLRSSDVFRVENVLDRRNPGNPTSKSRHFSNRLVKDKLPGVVFHVRPNQRENASLSPPGATRGQQITLKVHFIYGRNITVMMVTPDHYVAWYLLVFRSDVSRPRSGKKCTLQPRPGKGNGRDSFYLF
ncbi:hypothetical protein QBC46DRAFT_74327 [Diplogelasinospora grovesii]|uniref:Uncharacterized protein n=1 Tax=Diplogelasinospora grovesii TaxID=303347 RepID=A0AAN6S5Z4_9PEZI|nr:hypothetical protein QBC46DRAFT_74327 [Diplogelasinospora grovesii]